MISEAVINLGIVGFTCFLLVVYLLKFVFRYKHQYESNPLCSFTVITCLLIVLLITCLLPVDIFLVSFVKNTDGTFKEWATKETLQLVDKVMFMTYYCLYGLAITLVFLVLPFLHFFNDESDSSSRGRLETAMKYTFCFLLLMVSLLFVGAFIHVENYEPNDIFRKILPIGDESKLQSAILFVLAIILTLGLINVSFYTASGIFSWPIGLLFGTSSINSRYNSISDRTDFLRIQVATLQQRAQVEGLSEREQQQLTRAEDELVTLDREEAVLSQHRMMWSYKLRKAIRPMQIVFGFIFGLFSLVIITTLVIVNVDRLLNGAGPKKGYILLKPTFINPLEYVFTRLEDVVLIGPLPLLAIVFFLVVATISGIRNLGLWFMLTRLHRIKVGRTPPRALIFFCMTTMLAALSFNLMLYSMSSQYITFGNQKYRSQSTEGNSTITVSKPCTITDYHEDCLLTRTSILLMRMMSQVWIFGAIFYWSSWIFVAIGGVSLGAYLYRGKRQPAHDTVMAEDDFEE